MDKKNTGIVGKKLIGRAQILIQQLHKEGKITFLSKEETNRIDNALAEAMKEIKEESDLLQKKSWNAMKDIIIS